MEIKIINTDPIFDYKRACLVTKGKQIKRCSYPDTFDDEVRYWVKHFVAGHSCLRFIHFTITDKLPKSVIMQIIRATKGHPQPEVQSSRPDWTGEERSNNPYEEKIFIMDFTPESFIEMMKQRLCQKTEKNTRKAVTNWRNEMVTSNIPIVVALGLCAKAKCVYYQSCNEIEPCGCWADNLYERFIDK